MHFLGLLAVSGILCLSYMLVPILERFAMGSTIVLFFSIIAVDDGVF